ncbi:MAG: CAP domain-containing protein, partial [Campylobacter sp.]|nr:CAP domain-containing protein [Campylobacter sp.]
MQKQVRKLRFFLLLGAAFLLISCEKAPDNLKKPLESKSGFLVYDEPLNYLNNLRIKSGLNQLKQNQILDLAALNHAKYVVANSIMSHDEIQGKTGFTGENPSKRAEFVGYNSSVRENISFNADDLQSAIDGLMSAIYHRFAFLDFEIDEVGIAYFKNEKDASYAFEMGNSSLERFCSANKNDEGNGRFILGMCKDKTLKMKSDKFEMANRLNSTPFVYFPNSEPQQAFFSNEIPDPIPECKITANPIS